MTFVACNEQPPPVASVTLLTETSYPTKRPAVAQFGRRPIRPSSRAAEPLAAGSRDPPPNGIHEDTATVSTGNHPSDPGRPDNLPTMDTVSDAAYETGTHVKPTSTMGKGHARVDPGTLWYPTAI